ncbi:hypothetical protein HON58_05215 [Candidatus Peregrinibacteria bacterium]|jgi:hypothetical protein|nr:hypothetical protein [Candidatus Peregrinibacteria bacterium]
MTPTPKRQPETPKPTKTPDAPKAPEQTEAETAAATKESAEKKQARYEKAMDGLSALVMEVDSTEWKEKLERLPHGHKGFYMACKYAIRVEKEEALLSPDISGDEEDTFITVFKEDDARLVKMMISPYRSYLIVDQSTIVNGAPDLGNPRRMSPDKIEEIEQFVRILKNITSAVDQEIAKIEEEKKMRRLEKAGGF